MEIADESGTSASSRSSDLSSLPSDLIRLIISKTIDDRRYHIRPLRFYFPGPLATIRAISASSKQLRSCALSLMIRLSWEGELNVGRRLLHPSQLFFQAPSNIHLRSNKILKCSVVRHSKPFFFPPSFEFYEVDALSPDVDSEMKQARPPLLTATERNGSYEIRSRGGNHVCAHLVSHPSQLNFTLEMIQKNAPLEIDLHATYQTLVNGKVVPRKIMVEMMNRAPPPSYCELSHIARDSFSHIARSSSAHDIHSRSREEESEEEARDEMGSSDRYLVSKCHMHGGSSMLVNRMPYRSTVLHCWCLDFGGRVKMASVKNCQLHFNQGDSVNRLQFGKVREQGLMTVYTLDFDPRTMSALQAFAIALTTFKKKSFRGA